MGGIVGGNDGGTMRNCYNIGTVVGNGDYIYGQNPNDGEVTNCFALNSAASSSTFTGWDFTDTWAMSSQIKPFARPILKSCAEGFYDVRANEYAISNRKGMEMLSDYVNGTNGYTAGNGSGAAFKLTADIDLSGETWTPSSGDSSLYHCGGRRDSFRKAQISDSPHKKSSPF